MPPRGRLRIFAFIPLLLACGDSNTDVADGSPRDSVGVMIADHQASPRVNWLLDSAARREVGGSAPGSVDLFRVVAAIRLEDGRVIVAEGSPPRLLSFAASGTLLTSAGRRGSGPGEFEAISFVQVIGDSLLMYDPRLRRASVFTDSLRFVRSFSLRPPAAGGFPPLVGSFQDGTLLATSQRIVPPPPQGGMVRPKLVLLRYTPDGDSSDSLVTVVGDEAAVVQGIIARPSFAKRTRLAVGLDEFVVTTSERFELLVFGQDGQLRRIIRRGLEPVLVAEADVEQFRVAGLEGTMTYPSIDAILLDRDGSMWVKEHQATDGSATWVKFSRDGRMHGAMEPPAEFEPMQVGEDFVLGVWRNELGEESVRLYDLLRAPDAP